MNPHPTKSKPYKIGRKHTGALSVRKKQELVTKLKKSNEIKLSKLRKHKEKVSAFWSGQLDKHP